MSTGIDLTQIQHRSVALDSIEDNVVCASEKHGPEKAKRRGIAGSVSQQKTPWWRRMLLCGEKPRVPRRPASNPPGWAAGRATDYDIAKRPNRVVIINGEQETEFVPNMVRTSKYQYYSFLPMFLWEEFNPARKVANVYFLFIAALQVIPEITNTFGIPLMLLPLFFVVFVDAVFMIIEDVARHRADKFANSSPTRVWDRLAGAFKTVTWREIEVGDLIVINNREAIPCDVLIVGVDEPVPQTPAGIAYVETKSLDGETNLKIRQVVKGALGALIAPEDCASLHGRVVMEHPDKLINNFKGKFILDKFTSTSPVGTISGSTTTDTTPLREEAQTGADNASKGWESLEAKGIGEKSAGELGKSQTVFRGATTEPVAPDMLLLRGCVLRNTRWVVGLVLNTGPDTKIMMSMSEAPCKASHLSKRINEEIKRVAGVMAAACIAGGAASTAWNAKFLEDKWYLSWEGSKNKLAGIFFTQMLYYALLLNAFIPISLYVSMNFVRFLQAWFINQDLDMYYEAADTPARVRTMNLNEDLGQVSHVFSDKTGTLTCNIMDFRKFSVGGVSYGLGMTEIGRAAMVVEGRSVPADVLAAEEKAKNHVAPHVNFYDPAAYRDLMGRGKGGEDQAQRMRDFFTALAVCHTVIPEKFEDSDEVILSASSPDDEALVLGAKYFGFEFVGRVNSNAVVNTWAVETAPDAQPPACPRRSASGKDPAPQSPRRLPIFSGDPLSPRSQRAEGVANDQFPSPATSPRSRRRRSSSVSSEKDISPRTRRSGSVGVVPAAARGGFDGGYNLCCADDVLLDAGDVAPKKTPTVTTVNFEVLHLLGFTSDRKRMSVIVRTEDGVIKIICKGADTVMLPRLRTDGPGEKECIDATVRHMDTFAREGLRTLVVAQAELDPEAFERWADQFEEASNDLVEIGKKNRGEPNRIESIMDLVECNLEVVGSTAIEDKLQAGVANTVSDLMAAGIKIWVLTGDKEETAINIAVACQLLWTEQRMHRTVINLRDTESAELDEIRTVLEDFLEECIRERCAFEKETTGASDPPLPRGLVIDGPALLEALRTPESQCALLRAAQTCHCVVGCRMSPDQKRALVSLVRENVPGTRTLSIGDGANDVPMIQTAHIGVGISGQEGMQAVNASDYAIAQFAFLRKLLLVHGRWNYRRSSRVVCYLFYKSIMFAGPLIFYATVNGFSGTLYYEYVTANLYAVVYTALPILLYGMYDRDISAETCLRYPQLYAYGIKDGCMRPKIFWSWMFQALLESAFITAMPLVLLTGGREGMGLVTSTYDYGTVTFALVVVTVSFKMFWVQYRWTPVHVVVLVFSVFAFFASSLFVNSSILLNWGYVGVLNPLLRSGSYWAVTVWCLVLVVGRDWAWKFHHRWWSPRLHHLVMESEKVDNRRGGKETPVSNAPVCDKAFVPPKEAAADPAARGGEGRFPDDRLEADGLESGDGGDNDGREAAVVAARLPPAGVSGIGRLSPRSWTNDRTASTYDPPLPDDNGDDSDDGSDDGSASTEIPRDERPKRHRDCITSNVSLSQTLERKHDRAIGGASGRGANRWAKTLGWAYRSLFSPRFGQSSSPEEGGGQRAWAGPGAGGGVRAAAGGGRLSVTAPTVLESRMSAASLRNCDLGRDPREAAKLMSKHSYFVKVPGITSPFLPPSRTPYFSSTPGRRSSERSGSAASTSSKGTTGRRATAGNGYPSGSTLSGWTPRFGKPGDNGTAANPSVIDDQRRASGSRHRKSTRSTGGFAFSSDPQAQRAEIAMILGERPSPIKHAASFYEHRSSLRAQRISRVRASEFSGIVDDILAETTQSSGARGGLGGRLPLQRRNSYTIGTEVLGSASLSAASRHPRTYSGGADGGGSDLRRANGTGSSSNNNNGVRRDSLPLQLIVEEKTTDEGAVSPPLTGGGLGTME